MRRVRAVREHRDTVLSIRERRRRDKQKRIALARREVQSANKKPVKVPSYESNSKSAIKPISFLAFDEYQCSLSKPIKVCHTIDSLGLGGGQTMLMELVHGLNKYFGNHVINQIVYISQQPARDAKLFSSYGLAPIHVRQRELKEFLEGQNTDIVVQHRLMNSTCLKQFLPSQVKYILLNHTFHCLEKVGTFTACDLYVSVCEFLNRKTLWNNSSVNPTRRYVVLNGAESDYLEDIEPKKLEGSFKTGRCHRLVQSKFNVDSLKWMSKEVNRHIPGHIHYLIGNSKEAKIVSRKVDCCRYMGAIVNRTEKMSLLKSLDLYFYETFQSEGASVAILESLACGVPVLCKSLGGNTELVLNGKNGYVVKDRDGFLKHMCEMFKDRERLGELRQRVKDDFDQRLHVRHTACKYMQLFEAAMS